MNSFYTVSELGKLGFKKLGRNVLISRYAQFYLPEEIEIGNNSRIDDFCILSGKIRIGEYVHIAAYCGLFGSGGIEMKDFSGLSSRVVIYSSNDDYSGESLTNPTVPDSYKKVQYAKVTLNKHCIIGSGTIILPGIEIGEGASVGAMSLCNKSIRDWSINVGIPIKFIKERKKDLLLKEEELRENELIK